MLQLLVMRHAKSRWDDPDVRDFDRGLTPRGERAAGAVGTYLARTGRVPQSVLCSTARRARDTLDLASARWASEPEIRHDRAFYGAGAEDWLDAILSEGNAASPLMVVGHNPAVQDLALTLSSGGSREDLVATQVKFPTGAVAVIAFEASRWDEIEWRSGTLTEFVRPRLLDAPPADGRGAAP